MAKSKQKTASRAKGVHKLRQRLRDELRGTSDAAWLIDVSSAQLFPLTPEAAHLFAVDGNASDGITLDASMPAITKLRGLVKKRKKASRKRAKTKHFLFWMPSGAVRVRCQISFHKVGGRTICFLKSIEDKEDQECSREVTALTEPPPKAGDDAAILREIARQIRAGTQCRSVPDTKTTWKKHDAITSDVSQAIAETAHAEPETLYRALGKSDLRSATLAHELRTPISAIIAAAEIIKDERIGRLDNFHYRDYARDIYQSAHHALAVIERLLDQAAQGGSPAPVSADTDLNKVVQEAVSSVKSLAIERQISVTFVPSRRPTHIKIDRTTVMQILLNLLTNAVKFTGNGGRVEAQVYANVGEDIRIEVRDTGRGMTQAEIKNNLSGKLQPLPRQGGGLGLGLALSQQLAQSSGAALTLDSTPGAGTTAAVIFPLRRLVAV